MVMFKHEQLGALPRLPYRQREVAPAYRWLLVTHSRQLVNEQVRTTWTFKDNQLGALHCLPYLRHLMQHLYQLVLDDEGGHA